LHKSPWVSSDLLTLLAYNIGAAERGLEKEANLVRLDVSAGLYRALAKGAERDQS